MRQLIDAKFYFFTVLSIISVLILGNCGIISGTAKSACHNVPAVTMEMRESLRNTAVINNNPNEPGLSAAAYTTPLAFALRQSAIQKVRVAKPL